MLNIFSIHNFSQNSQPLIYEHAIQRIVDGDTLILSPKKGQSFRVRLYGIDCPEKRQEGGTAATEAAKNLASGQNVSMKSCYEDRYGRVVGIITFPDGTIMQEALLLQGHAWVDPHYCKAQIYDRWIILEKIAREARRGLWHDPEAIPPWEWRKGRRKNQGITR